MLRLRWLKAEALLWAIWAVALTCVTARVSPQTGKPSAGNTTPSRYRPRSPIKFNAFQLLASPAPACNVSLSVDPPALSSDGQWLRFTWSGYCNSSSDLWMALYAGSEASPDINAPLKYAHFPISTDPGATNGSVRLQGFSYQHTSLRAALVRGALAAPQLLAWTAPIPVLQPNQPGPARLAVTSTPGELLVQWSSANSSQPAVRWGQSSRQPQPGHSPPPPGPTATAGGDWPCVTGGAAGEGGWPCLVPASSHKLSRLDMCGGAAAGVGWLELGLQHRARLQGVVPGAWVTYSYGDPAWGWSPPQVVRAPPPPGAGFTDLPPWRLAAPSPVRVAAPSSPQRPLKRTSHGLVLGPAAAATPILGLTPGPAPTALDATPPLEPGGADSRGGEGGSSSSNVGWDQGQLAVQVEAQDGSGSVGSGGRGDSSGLAGGGAGSGAAGVGGGRKRGVSQGAGAARQGQLADDLAGAELGGGAGAGGAASGEAVRVLLVGDLGQAEEDGSSVAVESMLASRATMRWLAAEGTSFSLLLHVGDLAYARGFLAVWNTFVRQVQVLSSRLPYMTLPGNHERDWPRSGDRFDAVEDSDGECGKVYEALFNMPTPGPDQPWYGFDHGPIHFVTYSTEHASGPQSPQYAWIRGHLAAVNRSRTPWLVLAGHRPLYLSSTNNAPPDGDQTVASALRQDLEPLLLEAKVDLTLAGHHHTYQRTCPMANNQCVGYDSTGAARGPVHVVIGNGGAGLSLNNQQPAPAFIERLLLWWGYARLEANRSSLTLQAISNYDGGVMDSLTLVKLGA